ncbi:MAG: HlyD family efflux transporter periplasmic adaptor subunit [Phaeodactylibacter sp.]|nr:HlyD family efflux transporter periplasmic adaptor subunit [Phaeodactylibacter sp.]
MNLRNSLPLLFLLLLAGCRQETNLANAYGNFETESTKISSEANGKLLSFTVEEGQKLEKGATIGLVDTTHLHLQRQQLKATLQSFGQKLQNADAQIAVLKAQKDNLLREQDRLTKLVADKAATPQQLDDINGKIDVIDRQIAAAKSQNSQANTSISSGRDPVAAQIAVLDDQIRKCYLNNPVAGTVLAKYAREAEMVGMGSPLYSIASLNELNLRAYVSGTQLSEIAIGKQVTVRVDDGAEGFRDYPGTIAWIADEAEFTPKTIQTKEERTTLVYAIKVRVKNDGKLKIGMPGEVYWDQPVLANE